jgi:hypothetical protein
MEAPAGNIDELEARLRAAKKGNGKDESPKPPSVVVGAGSFMRTYAPISYTVEGLLPSGFMYEQPEQTGPR